MELNILQALKWLVHPPTAWNFIQEYLNALGNVLSIDSKTIETILGASQKQTEAAVRDCSLVSVKQSSIALACILNSLSSLECLDSNKVSTIISHISTISGKSVDTPEIYKARESLTKTCQGVSKPLTNKLLNVKNQISDSSPRKLEKGGMSPVSISWHNRISRRHP